MRFIYMIYVALLQDKLQCSVRKPTKACIITKESVENVYVYTAQAIFGHYRSDSYLCLGLWKMFQKYDASIVLLEQAAKIL